MPHRWRVTLAAEVSDSGGNASNTLVLRNEATDEPVAYLYVRWSKQDGTWQDMCTQGQNPHLFAVDRFGSQPNQLVQRCARAFAFEFPLRADARAVADVLTRLGYRTRVRLDLTERAMKDELRAFRAEVQGGDEVLFYFAGHGVQLAGANYLLPVDIRGDSEEQVRDDALPLQKVLDDLQDRKARFSLAIVDACRDNPFKTTGRSIGTRGLAPTTAATGQMVMFSAGAGQQALDRLGDRDRDPNGLFTRVLLREIDKPGMSVDRVLRTVRTQVVEMARSFGHEQVPALYDQSVGEFFFKR